MMNCRVTAVKERLSEAKESLDYLEAERSLRGDPEFGKRTEQQIIWRELLELQFQDAEERIASMCDAAERALALLG
ncbi:MAG TPA: hypothetical protein VKT49_07370 [Bryobacteraceae bacterium]|nr:hypothetical protein [Bryobacteraceae bacterium]